MRLLGFNISWEGKSASETSMDINTVIQRFQAAYELASGVAVNPDLAMRAPTVQAIVQAVARRMATLPIGVYRKTMTSNGRVSQEALPNHPATRLLKKPNELQTVTSFWLDAASWLVRYGNYFAFKSRGQTGPVRRLIPLHPNAVSINYAMNDPLAITYRVTFRHGAHAEYQPSQILHARGPARDGIIGDSPVMDVAEAIALEIAAEKFGAAFFGNGAMPGLIFNYAPGSMGFKTAEEEKKFTDGIQGVFAKKGRFKSLLLPKGVEMGDPISIENEKAQFLQTRQYQRTVIAGAFGVPPHMVGDLSKGTFNNVEQQSLAFVRDVVQPYATIFEDALEHDLLTDEDRASGVCIRFNLNAALRSDFKSRQEGLKVQREMGIINANEWREVEGMNPISEDEGGENYWVKGPSGQGADDATRTSKPGDDPQVEEDQDGDEGEELEEERSRPHLRAVT